MSEMPLVAVFQSDPRQIRPDASRTKQVRNIEGVFACLAHWSPAARLARHRTNVLGGAIPAAFAEIHTTAELLQRGVVGGLGGHPFELTQIGAHNGGHGSGPR